MQDWQISSVQQLRRRGWTRARLERAVRTKELWRIRKGYYGLPSASRPLVRAVRLGGRATAATALAAHGVWTPPDDRLHVVVPWNASRLSDPDARFDPYAARDDVHLHYQGGSDPIRPNLLAYAPVVELVTALEQLAACCPPEYLVAAVDSALHLRRIRPADVTALQHAVGPQHATALEFCDGRAETGSESVVRYRLVMAGLEVEIQVHIDGVGRVDILVEGRLVVEADSRLFHAPEVAYFEDRRRDRALTELRMPHLRLTYQQIFSDWPASERAVFAALE